VPDGAVFIASSVNNKPSPINHSSESFGVKIITSPPKVIWVLGRVRRYPHVGECTLPLCVLAVACTMHNEGYGALRDVMSALPGVMERYGSVVHRYMTLRNVAEALAYRVL